MRWLALGMLVALAFAASGAQAGAQETGLHGEKWLQGALNHVDRHHTVLIYTDERGRQYVRQLDLDALAIHPAAKPDHRHAAEWYYRLDEITDYEVHVDVTSGFVFFNTQGRPDIAPPPTDELLLDAVVNTERLADSLQLRYRHGELVLSDEALATLRIDQRKIRLLLKGEDELSLHTIAGENFVVDYQNLVVYMSVSPAMLQDLQMDARPHPVAAVGPSQGHGALFSYDVAHGRDTTGTSWNSGLFELAFASDRSTCSSDVAKLPYVNEFRRLDTQCTFDWVSKRESLSIGDAISQPDVLGAPVRFAGLRLGTDFGVDPYYIPQPTYSVAGSARVPSTLEVWVNQSLTYTQPLPPGPFSVDNIPVRIGAGELRAVVNDGLGPEQVLSQAYYSDGSLLKAGTWTWAFDAGKLREDYALPGDRYTDPFANLDVHYGVTDWLTITPHAEATSQFGRLALGFVARLGDFGALQLSGSAADSGGHLGTGLLARLSRRAGKFSFSLSHEVTDKAFVELGYPTRGTAPAEISQANVGVSLPGGISLSLGGSRVVRRDTGSLRLLTASMTIPIGRVGNILLTAFDPIEPAGAREYLALFVLPLGSRTTASASAFRQGADEGETVQVQQNAPLGPGYGYRLIASHGGDFPIQKAEGIAQWRAAALRLNVSEFDHTLTDEAELSGAVILSSDGLELGRRQDGPTATVQLPWPGVRIYKDEQLAAVTDAAGSAVVRGLRPYENNRLRLELDDLPLDAEVEDPQLNLVPGRRQIVHADFRARKTHHITARLVPRGARIPPGATAKIQGSDAEFTVGYDGLVYLEVSAVQVVTLQVEWPQGSCTAVMRSFTSDEAAVDAGDVPCQ